MKRRIALVLQILFCVCGMAADVEYVKLMGPSDMTEKKLGLRTISFGGGLKSSLTTGGAFSLWNVESAGDAPGWAMFGIEFTGVRLTPPQGVRLSLEVSGSITATFEVRYNNVPGKGFWYTERLASKPIVLKPGRQTMEVTWNQLGIKPEIQKKINAVALVATQPVAVKLYEFGLLYTAGTGESAGYAVPWIDTRKTEENPVARPLDKLSHIFSFQHGPGYTSRLVPDSSCGDVSTACWKVTGKPNISSWGAYGFGFIEPVKPRMDGVRFVVDFDRDSLFEINLMKGFSRHQGFYSAKKVGVSRKLQFPAGRRVLDIYWNDFGATPEDCEKSNAIYFVTKQPLRIHIRSVDLLYRDRGAANLYRKENQKDLRKKQNVMIQALADRGIPWGKSLAALSPDEVEREIWRGIQYSAQREQLKFFNTVYKPEIAQKLLAENKELVKKGEQGKFFSPEPLQRKINQYIEEALKKVPASKRAFRYEEKKKQFISPDGRPYRLFAPHFFRAIYQPDGIMPWRPADLTYLAGLGFNGIRLHVLWASLEPVRGQFNPAFLAQLKAIVREAERYGFGISFDLHWPYPQWFRTDDPMESGTPGFEECNSYHWPDALVESWERIGREFSDFPNIVAFEVPTNETPIGSTRRGLAASKYLMKRWNEFLKAGYGSRENLQKVWSASAKGADRYRLANEEDWDKGTIRPLGFQNDSSPDEAYANNPRFYDHLRFTAMMQRELSGRILSALRRSRPDAIGVFQRTIGDIWDRSPVPVNYHAVETCVGKHVIPGTHYGMGGISARKAATLSRGAYDSEQQMEGSRNAVENQVRLGLGFCPFAFHSRGGGGMLLCDDEWHLKPEAAYLPKMADWIRNFQPVEKSGPVVAVISNARLAGFGGESLNGLVTALEKHGCNVRIYESLRIQMEPELLKESRFVIINSSYLDPVLIPLLTQQYTGKVLFYGRLDMDAYARRQEEGLPRFLINSGLFLKSGPVSLARNLAGRMDLSGSWDFFFTGKSETFPIKPIPSPGKFEKVRVPGLWGETGITGSLQYLLGDGWYLKDLELPSSWKGRPLSLQLGAVDDLDWVFWNGKLIGHTGEDTSNYWTISRNYSIPADLIRWNQKNELRILVRNLRDDGGIWRAPVSITGNASGYFQSEDGKTFAPIPCDSSTNLLLPEQLLPQVKLLGSMSISKDRKTFAAFIQQGNIYWYGNHQFFTVPCFPDDMVLNTFLK